MSKKPSAKKDAHKSPHLVRLRPDLYQAMKALAAENDRPLTREISQALTAWLEAKGRLPNGST